jgi:ankyrin repeat protein
VVAVAVARTTSPKIQTPAVVLNNEVVSVAMALRMMPMLQMVLVPVPVPVLRVLQMLLIWWVVRVLLQVEGIAINHATDAGATALCIASDQGQSAVVHVLTEAGAQ